MDEVRIKACIGCKKELEENPQNFYRCSGLRSGFDNLCKVCCGLRDVERTEKYVRESFNFPQNRVKTCLECKDTFPATLEFFRKNVRCLDLLQGKCKRCCLEKEKNRRETPRELVINPEKTCARCKQTLPNTHEFFGIASHRKDGLTCYCWPCLRLIQKEYDSRKRAKWEREIKKRLLKTPQKPEKDSK